VSRSERFTRICRQSSTALIVCLPFLALFDGSRNLKLQGLLLLVAAVLAIPGLVRHHPPLDKKIVVLLVIYAGFCLLSSLRGDRLADNLFGPASSHLGILILLACLICGLSLLQYSRRRKIVALYAVLSAVGYLSVPYSFLRFHTLERISGLPSQPVVLGCLLAVGFVLGLYLFATNQKYRLLIFSNQLALFGLLLVTQTRAAIGLTLAATVYCYFWLGRPAGLTKKLIIPAAVVCLALFSLAYLPGRLHNSGYAAASIDYRFHLAEAAVSTSTNQPIVGYGVANIPAALDCQRLAAADLQQTCRDGYTFNSSHNIYLDRIIAIGWLGGIAYLGLVTICIYRGFRGNREAKLLSLAALVIALYYLTNITSVALELLFWVLLLAAAQPQTRLTKAS
jgi:O-antigen ligase